MYALYIFIPQSLWWQGMGKLKLSHAVNMCGPYDYINSDIVIENETKGIDVDAKSLKIFNFLIKMKGTE